jgi:hypothetical protein
MSDPKAAVETIHRQHAERARTLSELLTKLVLKRKGQLPKTFEELMTDYDIVKRAHEHVGACQAMNEVRVSLFPDEVPPAAPPTGA